MKKLILLLSFTTLFLGYGFASNCTTAIVSNINDSGPGSLRQAITDASNGDIIRFDPGLITGGSATITLTSTLSFSTSITIIGQYNAIDTIFISGGNSIQIMNSTSANLILDSVVFINGNATSNGSALNFNGGYLKILNSTVNNCNATAANVYGGAFYVECDSTLITNSIFRNNSGNSSTGRVYGGCLYVDDGFIKIEQSEFFGNQANAYNWGYGGAVHIYGDAICDISRTLFKNNKVYNTNYWAYGGAVYLLNNSSPTFSKIDKCTFDGNSTHAQNNWSYGGGLHTNTKLELTASTFINNSCTSLGAKAGSVTKRIVKQ